MSSIGAGSSPERHKSSEHCALVLPASKSTCACIRQQALSTYIAYMDRPYSRASALHRLVARVLSCRAHNVRRQSYRPRDLESKPSERKCCLQACDGAWQARHRARHDAADAAAVREFRLVKLRMLDVTERLQRLSVKVRSYCEWPETCCIALPLKAGQPAHSFVRSNCSATALRTETLT